MLTTVSIARSRAADKQQKRRSPPFRSHYFSIKLMREHFNMTARYIINNLLDK